MKFKQSDKEFKRYKEPKFKNDDFFEGGSEIASLRSSTIGFVPRRGIKIVVPAVSEDFAQTMKNVKELIDSNPKSEYMEYKASDKASSFVSIPSRILDKGDIQTLQDYFLQTKRIVTLPKDSNEKVGSVNIS